MRVDRWMNQGDLIASAAIKIAPLGKKVSDVGGANEGERSRSEAGHNQINRSLEHGLGIRAITDKTSRGREFLSMSSVLRGHSA